MTKINSSEVDGGIELGTFTIFHIGEISICGEFDFSCFPNRHKAMKF